ncbi:MAG TPA: GntR family transcriptional regulator [Solirubrobacteraceae bacterium]|nr:GntR family transcriptional regulator [Solirubrobacteraceae bacterium]
MPDHTAWGLGTVERRSTTDQVLHELRAAILAGRIKPTEQLPEVALAQAFGTGRSAIREAIRHLVQEGLVITEINRGARVRPVSTPDLIDVYRARTAIEVGAVGALLERPGFEVAPLRAAQQRIVALSPADGAETPSRELIEADIDFHRVMVSLAGSPRLSRAHEPLAAESQMLLNWHPVYPVSDYVADHQKLLEVIERRDPAAGDVVRGHLALTVDLLTEEATRYADRLTSAESLVHNDSDVHTDSHKEESLGD